MKPLEGLKKFYILLFSIIFILSQLSLNLFTINYVERLLIRQRLEQNEQMVRMGLETIKNARLRTHGGETLESILQELTSKTFFNNESFLCAIDANGYIVAHLDPRRVGLNRANERIETEAGFLPFTGEPYLVEGIWDNEGFSTVEIVSTLYDEELGITLAAHQNKSMVDRHLRVVRVYLTLFSVAILVVLFGMGWFLTYWAVGKYTGQIERYENELEAFTYSVSHDLRAPLRSIDGFSQALLEDCRDRLDERGRDYLQRVRQASQRMGELIHGLLRLSHVSRREMSFTRVDLSSLAREVAAELREKEPAREVELVIAPHLEARGDPELLRIVLQNLLENAWKYTSRQPSACIEVGVKESRGERAYFVRDDGAGFDMQYAANLFGPFQRLHRSGDFEGTGIGLATVQRIIHRHGGRVWAEGAVDQGATFFFTLP